MRDRVKEIRRVRASTLRRHAENWRLHGPEQRQAVASTLDAVGWGAPLLAYEDPEGGLTLIDGHLRADLAADAEVPVAILDLTPEEARVALATVDPLAALAETDQAAWDRLRAALAAGPLAATAAVQWPVPPAPWAGLAEALAPLPLPAVPPTRLPPDAAVALLAEPFPALTSTVFDMRDGAWQRRKHGWLGLGLRSEIGRGENLLRMSETALEPNREKRAARQARKLGLEGLQTAVATQRGTNGLAKALKAVSAADPAFYAAKRAAEARLGRTLSTEEFLRDHYDYVDEGWATGTSIFDPVLTEWAVRTFCPPGGTVLDPFAGGSVRGIVAAQLGRAYVGIDLSAEQVEANRAQAATMLGNPGAPPPLGLTAVTAGCPQSAEDGRRITDPAAISPIDELPGGIWAKREDLFDLNGARGTKARAIVRLLATARGVVGAGSRTSTMMTRVPRAAAAFRLPCRMHVAAATTDTPQQMEGATFGAEFVRHRGGYLANLLRAAEADAAERGWVFVRQGCESQEYLDAGAAQVEQEQIPAAVRRIVVCCGSGMALAALLTGMKARGVSLPVMGVRIGRDPEPLLDRWVRDWRALATLTQSLLDYETPAPTADWTIGGVHLDPFYEAKCIPVLRSGDLLWISAIRSRFVPDTPRG